MKKKNEYHDLPVDFRQEEEDEKEEEEAKKSPVKQKVDDNSEVIPG